VRSVVEKIPLEAALEIAGRHGLITHGAVGWRYMAGVNRGLIGYVIFGSKPV
jgi:hypothetical protein